MKTNPEKIAVTVITTLSLAAFVLFGIFYFQGSPEGVQESYPPAYPLDLSMVGMHSHDNLETDLDPAPTISIDVNEDVMKPGNFNVEIQTENFRFAPENISEAHVPGEGHAHVFVNDVKIGRAYGPWFHIPKLKPGEHTISVILSTNDHRDYATGGEIIEDRKTVIVQ